jgi:hypothetical protein
MPVLIACTLDDAIVGQRVPTATVTKGTVAQFSGRLGFWINDTVSGNLGAFCTEADNVIADVDSSLTWTQGAPLYESAGTPTGTFNQTSTAGRKLVGYSKATYPAGTSKIEARWTGANY